MTPRRSDVASLRPLGRVGASVLAVAPLPSAAGIGVMGPFAAHIVPGADLQLLTDLEAARPEA